jgi:hypothetical protein
LWWSGLESALIEKATYGAVGLFPENCAGDVSWSMIPVLRSRARQP